MKIVFVRQKKDTKNNMLRSNRSLLIILAITIIDTLGYAIVAPILYTYTQKFGLSDFENGFLFATFSICQFIAAPIIGKLSDKFGRKPVLIVSIAGTAASFFMMAFAPNAVFLFLARALDGITAGNYSVAAAVISDTTKGHERAKGFGLFGAANEFGFILGPLIAAVTVGIHINTPYIVAGCLCIATLIATILYLPETNKHIGKIEKSNPFDLTRMIKASFKKPIGYVLLSTFFYALSFSLVFFAFQPFCLKILGLHASDISILFTVLGASGLASQVAIVPNLNKKIGLKKALSFSLLLTSLSLFFMYGINSIALFVLACVLIGIFTAATEVYIEVILSKSTSDKEQGEIMGINSSYGSLGRIIGPILGGALATIAIPLSFLAGAFISLACLFLSTKMPEKIEKE